MEARDLAEEDWKIVTETKSGDWGQRNGNSCKIICKYIHIHTYHPIIRATDNIIK
jgi:hypothetical protein